MPCFWQDLTSVVPIKNGAGRTESGIKTKSVGANISNIKRNNQCLVTCCTCHQSKIFFSKCLKVFQKFNWIVILKEMSKENLAKELTSFIYLT